METAIQELERKIEIMQKLVDRTKEVRQKAMYQNSLTNAKQVLANFREVERILANGSNGNPNK